MPPPRPPPLPPCPPPPLRNPNPQARVVRLTLHLSSQPVGTVAGVRGVRYIGGGGGPQVQKIARRHPTPPGRSRGPSGGQAAIPLVPGPPGAGPIRPEGGGEGVEVWNGGTSESHHSCSYGNVGVAKTAANTSDERSEVETPPGTQWMRVSPLGGTRWLVGSLLVPRVRGCPQPPPPGGWRQPPVGANPTHEIQLEKYHFPPQTKLDRIASRKLHPGIQRP